MGLDLLLGLGLASWHVEGCALKAAFFAHKVELPADIGLLAPKEPPALAWHIRNAPGQDRGFDA